MLPDYISGLCRNKKKIWYRKQYQQFQCKYEPLFRAIDFWKNKGVGEKYVDNPSTSFEMYDYIGNTSETLCGEASQRK